MPIYYGAQGKAGPVKCVGHADPNRTATYASGGSQESQIIAFFSGDPAPTPDTASPDGLASRMATVESTGKDRPIQRATPTAGATVVSDGSPLLALLHSSLIATLTVTFPSSPRNGQQFGIASKSAVTALTLNGGSTIGGLAALTAAGFATWAFSTTDTAWVRTG